MTGSPIGRQCLRLELCIETEMTPGSAPVLPLGWGSSTMLQMTLSNMVQASVQGNPDNVQKRRKFETQI